jgi:hypothetical protein
VPGVAYSGDLLPFLAVALVFGIVNAFIGPVVKLLALPLIILTLGLFALVVNGFAVGVAWPRLSRERILGGPIRIACGEHRQHGALDFHRPRINALRSSNGAVVVATPVRPFAHPEIAPWEHRDVCNDISGG